MSEETAEQRDPMAEYQQQMEENEFLKREGFNAWADIIFDMMGDKFPDDKRPLIKEAIARFLGIGTPRFPAEFGPTPYMPLGPSGIDAEFIPPPPQIFEETSEAGVVTVYDWLTITMGATHSAYSAGEVYLFNYSEQLLILKGAAAESYWKWQSATRESMRGNGPIMLPVKRMRRRKSRRPA